VIVLLLLLLLSTDLFGSGTRIRLLLKSNFILIMSITKPDTLYLRVSTKFYP